MSQAKILATLKSVTCIKAKINSLFKYRLHSLAWNKFQFHIYTIRKDMLRFHADVKLDLFQLKIVGICSSGKTCFHAGAESCYL